MEAGTTTYMHHIVRLQQETTLPIDHQAILYREGERLGNLLGLTLRIGVNDTTRHIDTRGRSLISQTTSLNNQILNGRIIGIFITARRHDLTCNR